MRSLDRERSGATHGARATSLVALAVIGPFVAGCGGVTSERDAIAERFILISCDTLRVDRLGVYGGELGLTPNLDRFAEECQVFDAAYSCAPLTSASVGSLMTGRYPDEIGMTSNNVLIPAEATTLAEVLKANGFATAAVVSNWVLRKRPRKASVGFEQGFDYYDDRVEDVELNRSNVKERDAKDTTDAALRWLENRPGDRFFLWVHYQDPHGPYTPPDEFVDEDGPLGPGPERVLTVGDSHRGLGELPSYQVLGDERRAAAYRRLYEAEIKYFDDQLGRLLAALEREELVDDALILFTSDHGEAMGEHDYWFSHGQSLYRDLVHVPFLVRYPSSAAPPSARRIGKFERVGELIGHLDVFATVLDALGLDPVPSHGVSLLDGSPPSGRVVPQQMRAPDAEDRWESITDERWRLIETPDDVLLFDIVEDPGETTDLEDEMPDRVKDLRDRFESMRRRLPPVGATAVDAELTPEEIEEMNALGYTGGE